MYRPLPNGITITESGIDGLGVVATKTFKANTVLGIAHIANKNFSSWVYTNSPWCIL